MQFPIIFKKINQIGMSLPDRTFCWYNKSLVKAWIIYMLKWSIIVKTSIQQMPHQYMKDEKCVPLFHIWIEINHSMDHRNVDTSPCTNPSSAMQVMQREQQ